MKYGSKICIAREAYKTYSLLLGCTTPSPLLITGTNNIKPRLNIKQNSRKEDYHDEDTLVFIHDQDTQSL